MNVKVLFFGVIADITAKQEMTISDVKDTNALQDILTKNYPKLKTLKFYLSVNHDMVKANQSLKDKDEVALLPPFAGG